jgi:hypothetical protein
MTVYVDDTNAPYGRMLMSHMIADTQEELLQMCDIIGVQRKWIQYEGTYKEHFDIAKSAKAKAIQAGAVEITWRQTGHMIKNRREHGVLLKLEELNARISEKPVFD